MLCSILLKICVRIINEMQLSAMEKYRHMDVCSMKKSAMAAVGIAVTAVLMAGLAFAVWFYSKDPDDQVGMVAMGMLSSGLMLFLIIFALVYTKPSPTDQYMEVYQGICSACGTPFGNDGVCPKCGRRRPPSV